MRRIIAAAITAAAVLGIMLGATGNGGASTSSHADGTAVVNPFTFYHA